ncbi:hypothetical protein [Oleiharenicola lentus]|uniref:hypothetical protein n=1 Tax=Oleiharenicola lentus TaxID=2508720 RepID=UPI003F6678CD
MEGALRKIQAPVDLTNLQDNDRMLLVVERRAVRLTAPIRASFLTTGNFVHQRDKTPGILPAGLVVNSYFVTASSGSVSHYLASLKFSGETVLAIISYPEITSSHALFALDGVDYDINAGIDLAPAGGPDSFRLSEDRMTLHFDFVDIGLHDSFRILTITPAGAHKTVSP